MALAFSLYLILYSELEDQQIAPPTQSLFWRQKYYFVLTMVLECSYWRPFYDQTNTISLPALRDFS